MNALNKQNNTTTLCVSVTWVRANGCMYAVWLNVMNIQCWTLCVSVAPTWALLLQHQLLFIDVLADKTCTVYGMFGNSNPTASYFNWSIGKILWTVSLILSTPDFGFEIYFGSYKWLTKSKKTSSQSCSRKLYIPKSTSSGMMSMSSLALASFCRRKSRLSVHSCSSSRLWA